MAIPLSTYYPEATSPAKERERERERRVAARARAAWVLLIVHIPPPHQRVLGWAARAHTAQEPTAPHRSRGRERGAAKELLANREVPTVRGVCVTLRFSNGATENGP